MKPEPSAEIRVLRLAIDRREEQLEAALNDLVHTAERRASVGYYVGRYPWQVVLGGFAFGAWLGQRQRLQQAENR